MDEDERILLIGGPHDGDELQWTSPPPIIRMPGHPRSPFDFAGKTAPEYAGLDVHDYVQLVDATHHPSRDDDGRLRYRVRD